MANNQQKGVSAESWHFLYEPVIDYLNGTKVCIFFYFDIGSA